jgi:phosphotransferase system, enzyme I, PtsP
MDNATRSDTAITASRRLFARLRESLAQGTTPLPKLVALVAVEMACEVCSLYVIRPGELLELAATYGLEPGSVGRTRMRVGEGIVGLVAAMGSALNLTDAREHHAFAHRPETGEEAFASLVALPIRRSGHIIGVLTIQSRLQREFTDLEMEALETVAMLLAEMLAAQGAIEIRGEGFGDALPRRFQGLALADGVVIGAVVRLDAYLSKRQLLAADPAEEQLRLIAASERVQSGLDELIGSATDGHANDILAAYRLIAMDGGWLKRVAALIDTGLSAEAAVMRIMTELRDRMRRIADPYLRERLVDIEDLGNRLMTQLGLVDGGVERNANRGDVVGAILVARRLGPAELLDWHRRGIAAFVLEEGSAAGHAAILARSMGLPALSDVRGVMDAARDGDDAILDTEEGLFILRPEDSVRQAYASAVSATRSGEVGSAALVQKPTVTKDGVALSLLLNLGLPLELPQIEATGAAGIGLYRTEIAQLAQSQPSQSRSSGEAPGMELPSERSFRNQIAEYSRVLDHMGDRPLLFRTLDLGGDKLLAGADVPTSENPAMGWRSLRVGLDRPSTMRRQLRALIKAAQGRPLSIMFPMVATISEFRAARSLLDAELARASVVPARISAGTMLEIPALLWQLPALMREADFVSVGSNDLLQFLFAADRGTPNLAGRYDLISEPVLDVLESIVQAASAAGVPLSFCGEAAGRPMDALVLAAIGFRTLSMAPSSLLRVKATLRRADLRAFTSVLQAIRDRHAGAASLREPLASWAREKGITV